MKDWGRRALPLIVALALSLPVFANPDRGASPLHAAKDAATAVALRSQRSHAPSGLLLARSEDNLEAPEGASAMLGAADEATRVAIAQFDDHSRVSIDNLGAGIAEKLADRLSGSGIRVIGGGEMETWMVERSLDPTSATDLSFAAQALGADYAVAGVVDDVVIDMKSLGLGLVSVSSADARVDLSAKLVRAGDGVVASVEASGSAVGQTSVSFDLGSLFPSSSRDVCGGGLRSDQDVYAEGAFVSLGYLNPATSAWFGIEIYAADGTFLRWLGWRFVAEGACESWVWNQRDALGSQVQPGAYTVRLREGDALTDEIVVQIRPGLVLTLPSPDEVTVGAATFDSGAAGLAIDDAVDRLAVSLLSAIATDVARAVPTAPRLASASDVVPLLGQVAALLPDGRVSVNIGSESGVAVGDRYEVIAAANITYNPATLAVESYSVVAVRGEIEIVDVRERASTGVCLGGFAASIGDFVRRAP